MKFEITLTDDCVRRMDDEILKKYLEIGFTQSENDYLDDFIIDIKIENLGEYLKKLCDITKKELVVNFEEFKIEIYNGYRE
jgi:hypothetical protein